MLLDLSVFDSDLLVLLLYQCLNLSYELVCDISYVSPTFTGANRIHEGNLVEESLTEGESYLPTVADSLEQLWLVRIFEV